MKLDTKRFDEICDNFERYCPMWVDDVVRCVPRNETTIRAYLKNGDCVDYDDRTATYRYRANGKLVDPFDMTDETCRNILSVNLKDLMNARGITQSILSKRTGISQAMLSKYTSKRATPSLSNAYRIAEALACSIDELIG